MAGGQLDQNDWSGCDADESEPVPFDIVYQAPASCVRPVYRDTEPSAGGQHAPKKLHDVPLRHIELSRAQKPMPTHCLISPVHFAIHLPLAWMPRRGLPVYEDGTITTLPQCRAIDPPSSCQAGARRAASPARQSLGDRRPSQLAPGHLPFVVPTANALQPRK